MKITLLIHEKENRRADNTGQLLSQIPALDTNTLLWQRTQPNTALVAALNSGQAVLLSQQGDGELVDDISDIEHLVILDGTWQEAKKIYNKSPYLKTAKWYKLTPQTPSKYNLRRNQVEDGLCTAECAIEVLKQTQQHQQAAQLDQALDEFLAADRRNKQF